MEVSVVCPHITPNVAPAIRKKRTQSRTDVSRPLINFNLSLNTVRTKD